MDLTVDHVLDVTYPEAPEWSADGAFLAWGVHEEQDRTLYVADVRDGASDGPEIDRDGVPTDAVPTDAVPTDAVPTDAVPIDAGLATFAWAPPTTPGRLAVVDAEGTLYLHNAHVGTTERLTDGVAGDDLAWDDAGDRLAAYRDGRPVVVSIEEGDDWSVDGPERGGFLGESRMLAFAGDGLAYRCETAGSKGIAVVDAEIARRGDDPRTWLSTGPDSCHSPAWLGDGRVLFVRQAEFGKRREVVAVDPTDGAEETFFEEYEETGALSIGAPTVSPGGDRVATAMSLDGWDHLHAVDAAIGDREQLTQGAFEDKGLAGSAPQWLDEDTLVFASNREDPGWRGIFAVPFAGGEAVPLVTTPGSNVHPTPSPAGDRLAYVHSDADVAGEIRIADLTTDTDAATPTSRVARAGGDPDEPGTRVTESAVREWPVDPVAPERLLAEGPGGLEIVSYLLDPRDAETVADDATDLPLVVWVHGGPMRQMRDGWHPGRSYGIAYSVMQYLAQQGYVGLMVNYRGGIGYGREFRGALTGSRGREEMEDVVAATAAAQSLAYVADDDAAIWGLSYGGYATLQLLGTHPGVYDLGVNLAGLADLELYRDWAEETKYPSVASPLTLRMGGEPWENPEAWTQASPVTHFDAYEDVLYSYHGTGDRYVNVEQQDLLVEELVGTDVAFEFEYYPGESHVFGDRDVWARVLSQFEDGLAEHLDG